MAVDVVIVWNRAVAIVPFYVIPLDIAKACG